MKRPLLIAGVLTTVAIATVLGVFAQRQQLAGLRNQEHELLARLSEPSAGSSVAASFEPEAGTQPTANADDLAASELLQLRNQISRLTARQRELASVRSENERLRAEVTARNSSSNSLALPPGYILRRNARWSGSSTPEDTVQSFLWTLENRDLTNLLQLCTPRCAAEILQQATNSSGNFFDAVSKIPGMRVILPPQLNNDVAELKVQIAPGDDSQGDLRLRRIGGQWKLDQ